MKWHIGIYLKKSQIKYLLIIIMSNKKMHTNANGKIIKPHYFLLLIRTDFVHIKKEKNNNSYRG